METWRHEYMDMETWTMRHGYGNMDMETWTWRHGHGDMDMKTWTRRHGHGDMDMETRTWTWKHGHGNRETWRHQTEKGKRKPRRFSLICVTICSPCKRKFVVCLFVNEETNASYPFANGLNGLNGLAHPWAYICKN